MVLDMALLRSDRHADMRWWHRRASVLILSSALAWAARGAGLIETTSASEAPVAIDKVTMERLSCP